MILSHNMDVISYHQPRYLSQSGTRSNMKTEEILTFERLYRPSEGQNPRTSVSVSLGVSVSVWCYNWVRWWPGYGG